MHTLIVTTPTPQTSLPDVGISVVIDCQISVVVVSYNRVDALIETLAIITSLSPLPSRIVVVDNASTDDSASRVRATFPNVQLIIQPTNSGVAAFNQGVRACDSEFILILDDDARPDPASLAHAHQAMQHLPTLVAVPLLPVHPKTNRPEWREQITTHRFPMMGCANLVRRSAWLATGGYCEAFFLYRNDTDLALCFLALQTLDGSRHDVYFNPAWHAWHDSPAATRKSERWLELATRNWIWMARRHARGFDRVLGPLLGALWALWLASVSISRVARVLTGVFAGIFSPAPKLPIAVKPDGLAYRALLRKQLRRG